MTDPGCNFFRKAIFGVTLIAMSACGGSRETAAPTSQGQASPPVSMPTPTPTPALSEDPRESLVGLDVTLTITAASSFTLRDGEFAVEGDITRSYNNDTDMFA